LGLLQKCSELHFCTKHVFLKYRIITSDFSCCAAHLQTLPADVGAVLFFLSRLASFFGCSGLRPACGYGAGIFSREEALLASSEK
jgi:hypothetical protein